MHRTRTKLTSARAGSNDITSNDHPGLDTDTETAMITSNSTTTKPTTSAPKADKKASSSSSSSSSRLTQPTAATVARQKELEVAKAARAEKDAKVKKAAKAIKAAVAAKEAKDAKLKAEKDAAKEAKDAVKDAKDIKAKAGKEARIKSGEKRVPVSALRKSTTTTPTQEEIVASLNLEAKKGRIPNVRKINIAFGLNRLELPPPPPSQPKHQTTTTRATAPLTKTLTSLTKSKPSSPSFSTIDQKEFDLSIATLASQCTSILEGLDEQVQINQALVSGVEKLRQENSEFRKENAEIKRRLERIEGIVINILRGDDTPMEVAIYHEEGVVEETVVERIEEVEKVKTIEDTKGKDNERRRSGRKRKSSAMVEKAEEELGKTPRKTRRVTFGKGREGKMRKSEVPC
ncbi:hypothetical protein EV426DRAFT_574698 [Tirmania nivea]|nr:hypothetical protein EV426DRAFT_574698 [Tirmania nivea]